MTQKASRSTSGHCPVLDLEKGHQVDQIFLVEHSNFKQTRNNKYFIQTELRDRSGSIKGIRWEADRKLFESFGPADFVHVTGRVEEFQQHLQIIIDGLRKVDETEVAIEDFLPTTEKDIDALERELRGSVESLRNRHLKRLLSSFLDQEEVKRGLRRCPAGRTLHHAWVGGLLEHTVSLVRAADLISGHYPQLNRDLLLAGCILHDIGKIRELSYERAFRYTDVGQMVGHIAIGIAWTGEVARRIDGFPEALLVQLQHLIASHHGEPEFGAVKQPMTQEAVALHYLDNLDAKLSIFETVQKQQRLGNSGDGTRPGEWSDWHPAMGRRLYFPGS